jgi:hypothetical protein
MLADCAVVPPARRSAWIALCTGPISRASAGTDTRRRPDGAPSLGRSPGFLGGEAGIVRGAEQGEVVGTPLLADAVLHGGRSAGGCAGCCEPSLRKSAATWKSSTFQPVHPRPREKCSSAGSMRTRTRVVRGMWSVARMSPSRLRSTRGLPRRSARRQAEQPSLCSATPFGIPQRVHAGALLGRAVMGRRTEQGVIKRRRWRPVVAYLGPPLPPDNPGIARQSEAAEAHHRTTQRNRCGCPRRVAAVGLGVDPRGV